MIAALCLGLAAVPGFAQTPLPAAPAAAASGPVAPSYADLADLADKAGVVVRAQITKVARLKPEQAPNVRPGWARLYVEAKTEALLIGPALGESQKFLADVRLSPDGKLPKLRKAKVLLFANQVPGKPGTLQLVAPDAQLLADPALEGRVRGLLTELVSADAAPRVTGVREALYVPGNLIGEGETQIFMTTEKGDPVSITVLHRPGQPTQWGVSLSEIVDQSATAPQRDTLLWYRLACALPADLLRDTILSGNAEERRRAAADYRFVIEQLGQCGRTRAN